MVATYNLYPSSGPAFPVQDRELPEGSDCSFHGNTGTIQLPENITNEKKLC